MSDLVIIHRSHRPDSPVVRSAARADKGLSVPADLASGFQAQSFLMWETCRRQIFFSEDGRLQDPGLSEMLSGPESHFAYELYRGLDAEEFLVEVLCGLKSPLVGETEVFGQFRNWWQNLQDGDFKNKFSPRIQQIYSIVKKVREEALCGMGSQSYGSLLRKKISERFSRPGQLPVIDFIGGGQLVEEMVPWIQKKWSYRIWGRTPDKILRTSYGAGATAVLPLMDGHVPALSPIVVVAAPLSHYELHRWFARQPAGMKFTVYDFRHDSAAFIPPANLAAYAHLDHFTTEVEGQKQEIQSHIGRAYSRIESWKEEENSRVQIRPFGWDDL